MFRFYIYTKQSICQLLAVLVLGALLGAAGVSITATRELDRLYLENRDLQMELKTKNEQVKQLEESLRAYRRWVVQEIVVEFDPQPEKHLALEAEMQVRDLLKKMIGREIESLDHELVYRLIDERIIRINDGQCLLNLKSLIVHEKLKVVIRLTPVY